MIRGELRLLEDVVSDKFTISIVFARVTSDVYSALLSARGNKLSNASIPGILGVQ